MLQDPGTDASRWIAVENKQVCKGAGGLVSTAHDYLRFQQAMMNAGQLDGVRLLSPNTLDLMMENHTGDLALWLPGPGFGFGLGCLDPLIEDDCNSHVRHKCLTVLFFAS